jgi:hypothetical protein
MKLKEELQLLRAAAHSLQAVENPNDCLALVLKGSPYDQMFFSELSDPTWLAPLRTAGVFQRLPKTATRGDMVYYPRHVPLIGLTKLAVRAPADVVSILEILQVPDNPQVHDQIMRVIAAIDDASFAPRLVPVLEKLFSTKFGSEWIWLDDILKKWLKRGAEKPCVDALRAALKRIAGDLGDPRNREDWYINNIDREVISRLAERRQFEVAELLFDILRIWARSERKRLAADPADESGTRAAADPDYDYPWTYWLEQFGAPRTGLHDFEHTLAQRLYSTGRLIFESADSGAIERFDKMLRVDRWHLFRRMRWQLYADFPSLTLQPARYDVLERIPRLGEAAARHNYEFAAMLEAHVNYHGPAFLSGSEVNAFVRSVLSRPTEDEIANEDLRYRERFEQLQLYPIRKLLAGDALQRFKELSGDGLEVRTDAYKPFSSSGGQARAVEHVSPMSSSDLAKMPDAELWAFLNTWVPSRERWDSSKWWVEQDVGALGLEFAKLVESEPSRFAPEKAWWHNLQRPQILSRLLERATTRIEKASAKEEVRQPTTSEWRNWFGIATWITDRRATASEIVTSKPDSQDWNWPGIVVVKFLRAVLQIENSQMRIFRPQVAALIRKLVEDPDPILTEVRRPQISEWLTTGINSVRGTAVEALFELALTQKKDETINNPEPWIFDLIAHRLRVVDESPAIFAIVGARLRLAVHLFQDRLRSEPELLLPNSRRDHRASLLMAHVLYDGPMSAIVETLPNLPVDALECLEQLDQQRDQQRDFGSRLGVHLSFYYWNGTFCDQVTADNILDHFFEVAKPQVRANTIGEIARIFTQSGPVAEHAELYRRTLNLWDRRFSQIEAMIEAEGSSASGFYEELSEFMRWLDCECFALDWRFDRILKAIRRMDRAPRSYTLMETLDRLAATPELLHRTIVILHAVISKRTDEMMWGYREEKLKPLLEKGLGASDRETVRLTEEVQERLLRDGFLEYVDITARENSAS